MQKLQTLSQAIKYEPSGYKKPQTNECQFFMPNSVQLVGDLDSATYLTNRMSRPMSALSHRVNKINSTSVLEKQGSQLNDTRTTPRYIRKDKEDLYKEVLALQQSLNSANQEITKLKTQNTHLEREVNNLTDMLRNVEMFVNKKTNIISVFELKKSISDLKQQLTTKTEELKQAKFNAKAAKLEEMRVELKEAHIECLRLRTLLDQNARSLAMMQYNDHTLIEEKVYIQGQMLNSLKAENDQFVGMLKIQEEETIYYKNLLNETLKTVRRYEEVIDDLHKNLKGKNQFMDKLAQRIDILRCQNNGLVDKVIKVENCKTEIRKQNQAIEDLEKQLRDSQSNCDYLSGLVNELKLKNAEKSIFEAKEKKLLLDQIQKIQSQYDLLDERYKNLLFVQSQNNRMKETLASSHVNFNRKQEQTQQPTLKNDSFQQNQVYVPKKLRVVKTQDVQPVGWELNQRFRLKKISLSDVIEQYLFDDRNKKEGIVTLRQLHDRFQIEPFLLLDYDKSMLLARYLIEDNQSEFVEFNIDQSESLVRVSSVFSKLIGKYRLFTLEDERRLKDEIIPIIVKYRQSLKQHFDSLSSPNGELSKKQLIDTFIFMDIDFNQEQLEFFFLKLFALSNNIDQFPYQKIFEIFQPVVVQDMQLQRSKTTKKKPEKLQPTKSYFKQD